MVNDWFPLCAKRFVSRTFSMSEIVVFVAYAAKLLKPSPRKSSARLGWELYGTRKAFLNAFQFNHAGKNARTYFCLIISNLCYILFLNTGPNPYINKDVNVFRTLELKKALNTVWKKFPCVLITVFCTTHEVVVATVKLMGEICSLCNLIPC